MNNLVYFRANLVGSMIVIVSWAFGNNLVYFWYSSWCMIMIVNWSYPMVGL